jgi:hypothetical protein
MNDSGMIVFGFGILRENITKNVTTATATPIAE